eukprot:928287_1
MRRLDHTRCVPLGCPFWMLISIKSGRNLTCISSKRISSCSRTIRSLITQLHEHITNDFTLVFRRYCLTQFQCLLSILNVCAGFTQIHITHPRSLSINALITCKDSLCHINP